MFILLHSYLAIYVDIEFTIRMHLCLSYGRDLE